MGAIFFDFAIIILISFIDFRLTMLFGLVIMNVVYTVLANSTKTCYIENNKERIRTDAQTYTTQTFWFIFCLLGILSNYFI